MGTGKRQVISTYKKGMVIGGSSTEGNKGREKVIITEVK